uniref:hypothetical protein n=1 Tax=Candidatus Vondammii sp. HM_W22 TaxID=2687299 RepID=UPI001F13D5D6|nr:hypothetical protein [Candidatus Vondammii sp. HM_W22]
MKCEEHESAVSRLMGLSWNAIDGIMQRAVKQGLARRTEISPTRIGVDETAFKKRVCHVTLALCQQDIGKKRLGAVVVMSSAQWPGANQESGWNNQESSVENIERCCFGRPLSVLRTQS